MDIILEIAVGAWGIVRESAFYILAGFVIGGVLHIYLPVEKVTKYLKPRNVRSILYASLAGIPLPLCSCGVVPAAMALRKHGASKGATSAFLISTPESGVDSIAITYALMDPVVTVFRPVAAFFTAFVAGMGENIFGREEAGAVQSSDAGLKKSDACGCDDHCTEEVPKKTGKIHGILDFAFNELMNDLAGWLALGFLVAGLIGVLIPDTFLTGFSQNTFVSMVVMLMAGIPLYVCATASTPVAAALVLKGLNPGAALVFLLAGPATNASSMAVLYNSLGVRSLIIYLTAIAVSALAAGYAINAVYATLAVDAQAVTGAAAELFPDYINLASAALLLIFMIRSMWRNMMEKLKAKTV